MPPEGTLWQNVNVLRYISINTVYHSMSYFTVWYYNVYDALVSTY